MSVAAIFRQLPIGLAALGTIIAFTTKRAVILLLLLTARVHAQTAIQRHSFSQ